MTYTLVNITKPAGGNPGAKGGINSEIIIIDKNDVLTYPERDANNTTIATDLALKAGKKMHILEATASTIDFKHELTGEDDARSWDISLELSRPGQETAWEEFLNNNINTDFYIINRMCATNDKKLAGTPCAPMKLDQASSGFKEGNKTMLVFKAINCPFRAAIYTGALDIEGDSAGL